MCLGIPGRVEEIDGTIAKVRFGDLLRKTSLDLLGEDVSVGDYVIVHAGFALGRIDEDEAHQTLQMLKEISDLEVP